MIPLVRGVLTLLLVLLVASPVLAFDPDQTFRQGAFTVSPELGYGHQFNLEDKHVYTGVEFVNAGVRFGWLPFRPVGPGPLHGALEIGLEPVYQRYFDTVDAFFGGLGATVRYSFLSLGRFVPYVEVAAAAGGTDLKISEIRSDFTFMLWGGVGLSYFVTDHTAIYGGYRYQHVSNGNTERVNRGFESNGGVAGVSFYFE
ncbi:MAG TPA: acyloxyacyl hydrolase [Methylomirabilota bacterium]|jgi:Lipid A 3-O-deacylase (PagL)|nr:acyloxyacyl hydrolase [Methylomirabilota bacterium]